jgi:hypothetical protein
VLQQAIDDANDRGGAHQMAASWGARRDPSAHAGCQEAASPLITALGPAPIARAAHTPAPRHLGRGPRPDRRGRPHLPARRTRGGSGQPSPSGRFRHAFIACAGCQVAVRDPDARLDDPEQRVHGEDPGRGLDRRADRVVGAKTAAGLKTGSAGREGQREKGHADAAPAAARGRPGLGRQLRTADAAPYRPGVMNGDRRESGRALTRAARNPPSEE